VLSGLLAPAEVSCCSDDAASAVLSVVESVSVSLEVVVLVVVVVAVYKRLLVPAEWVLDVLSSVC